MKKITLSIAFIIAMIGSSIAQKATLDNPWSLEGGININSAAGINWSAPTIRARYFFNENIAARAQSGLGDALGTPLSNTEYIYKLTTGPDGGKGTIKTTNVAWTAQIGAEYHFAGTDRLSPYALVGFNFGGGKEVITKEDVFTTFYASGYKSEQVSKSIMFGGTIGFGLDIYVIENLYLGLELGVNLAATKYSDIEISETIPAGVTINKVMPGESEAKLETGTLNAGFRLGWRF